MQAATKLEHAKAALVDVALPGAGDSVRRSRLDDVQRPA